MMPFYGNAAQFVAAVESVRRQTDHAWRLVVVDDRYPDPEPGRWVRSLADPRIRYVLNDKNLGVSGNFQRCVELARAEYVVIMGCDDIMLPGYVARARALIKSFPDAAYIQPGVVVIDDDSQIVRPLADRVKARFRPSGPFPRELGGEQLAAGLLQGNWTYFPSLCWRTADIRVLGFRPDFSIVLDLALQLALVERGGTLVVDDQTGFQYRRHASVSSWSGSGARRFEEEKALFREFGAKARELGWHRAARAASMHITSRLNALVQLSPAMRSGTGARKVLNHVFSR